MPRSSSSLAPADRSFLLHLQRQALEYFLDNQAANGLMLDRQSNHGPWRVHGLCSTAATGMGLIGLALATAPPHALLSRQTAVIRVRTALETALDHLPHDEGILPHFVDSQTGEVWGRDYLSTVDSAWLYAGALWAAAFLRDTDLERLATRLYDRVNWQYWSVPEPPGDGALLRHGRDRFGRFLDCRWDRLNGETAFMYVLAAGADDGHALSADTWAVLRPFYGTIGGRHFNNADLGLFVFQYGLDLLDFVAWKPPGPVELAAEARVAAEANHEFCRAHADVFPTYRRYWGLSAGDGPDDGPDGYLYRCYAPGRALDGTAHVTATLASVAQAPDLVLTNLHEARCDRGLCPRGRYGFSNLNVGCGWVSRDIVGIDAGAALLALENYLMNGRVWRVFEDVPCVRRGLDRLGCVARALPTAQQGDAPLARAS
jgi:hypothetical protein